MNSERWQKLMADDTLALTASEKRIGWHFCNDYDGLLVGPTMGEWRTCQCFRHNSRLAFERRCIASGLAVAPKHEQVAQEDVF